MRQPLLRISAFLNVFVTIIITLAALNHAVATPIHFVEGNGRVAIVVDGQPIAVYVYHDERIKRPFFAHVCVPSGIQVTRHHPPISGQDLTDHDTFHPGIWLSFGDINGSDYWRGNATVRHVDFAAKPHSDELNGGFTVRNEYLNGKDPSKIVCRELAKYTLVPCVNGFQLWFDSTLMSDEEFALGDQEEMGLGFRTATPIRADKKSEGGVSPGNGTILDSSGRKNGDQIWGNTSDWCDYSGTIAGHRVGISLFCHPGNFRPSWFHARDYGLLAANAFGRQAFGKGDKSSVHIKPGESLRLRYCVFVHDGADFRPADIKAAYDNYVRSSRE